MKKHLFSVFAIVLLTATITSCNRLGLNDASMDSEEVASKVKETVAKNVDVTKWKIYEITCREGEILGNKLSFIDLSLINKEGNYFTQKIKLNAKHEFVAEEMKEPTIPKSARDEIVYDEVVGIDYNKLDGKLIAKQLESAKALIPEEYKFESVASYTIKEKVHRITKMDKMLHTSDKKEKEQGKQSVSMTLNVVKKGEGAKMEGRRITTNYYEIPFVVKEDGSLEIVE